MLIPDFATRKYLFMKMSCSEGNKLNRHRGLARELTGVLAWVFWFNKLLFARSTEYGSRTLVHAASQGSGSHGQYLSHCDIAQPGPLVMSENGEELQERVWNEVADKLEKIKPGILENI